MKNKELQTAKYIAIILVCVGVFAFIYSSISLYNNISSIGHYYTIRPRNDVIMIRGWMTPNYIARSYLVPEQLLLESIHTTSQKERMQSLDVIAQDNHVSVRHVIGIIHTVILQYKTSPSITLMPTLQSTQNNKY